MTHLVQINDTIREATADEIQALEQLADEYEQYEAIQKDIAAAKTSARTKLKALGLTDVEIAALVG